jgi:hypothetical protein
LHKLGEPKKLRASRANLILANVFSAKIARSAGSFHRNEQGGMTALSLFGIVVCCMFAGLAIDVSNLHRHKQFLTVLQVQPRRLASSPFQRK